MWQMHMLVIESNGYQSTRHTVKSLHGQLVTQSTRHRQLVTMLNYADGQLVTRSSRHTVNSSHGQQCNSLGGGHLAVFHQLVYACCE